MIDRARVLHLGGTSALAIGTALAFIPVEANACSASANMSGRTIVSVDVVCDSEDVAQTYATSVDDAYDGNGDDTVVMRDGSVFNNPDYFTPGEFEGIRLDQSTGVIELLGGDDRFEMYDGMIGEMADPVGVSLGAGADTFHMSGGTITGSVFGLGGSDTFTIGGGTIYGSLFAGSENDTVTISGDADIQGDVTVGPDSVGLEDGDDTFDMTGGVLGGAVSGGRGGDLLTISGGMIGSFVAGNQGADQITVSGGTIGGDVIGGEDDDVITIDGGAIATNVSGDDGNDQINVSAGTIGGDVSGGTGDDSLVVSGGTIAGSVFGLGGSDTFTVGGGTIHGSLFAGSENDTVTISGDADIQGDVTVGPDSVGLEDGDDTFDMTGGVLGGAVSGGRGGDLLTISGGMIGSFVAGNQGADRITVSGGTIGGDVIGGEDDDVITIDGGAIATNVSGDDGNDRINVSAGTIGGDVSGGTGDDSLVVSGGTIAGNVQGETVILTGGTIGGDVSGITGNTLIIDDSASATALSLRDGVVFGGIDAVGRIDNSELAAGGLQTQTFTGFTNLTVANSTLGFGTGTQGVGFLSLTNGSTLFVTGDSNLAGDLSLDGSAINMINGAAADLFTLGGLAINNGWIGIDLNQQTLEADQLIAQAFSATGVNTIAVNLLGTPEFAGQTDVPIIIATNDPTAATFLIEGIPGTPGSLFTYEVIAGAEGGLFIRATPAYFGLAAATQNAVDVSTVETAIDALYGINNDAIAADLGLAHASGMVQITPTFGVFASGQLAHVEHDGFTITNSNLVGPGPSFAANDFSAAISVDFNAAKHFGFDEQYGLNLGLFAGYASTDVGLDAFQGFDRIGDASNKSGMFGGYGLFRQGLNYALISASAFVGETDVRNDVLNTTGSYDTEGYAVTGSVGHIFALSDRTRFDLRGGVLGVTFSGGDYTDSGGNQFGKSRISFGAIKFEPGIYADYQLENGMVFSPYARADLQQRFGYRNTSIIDGRYLDFDDADFSAALSSGFNLRVSQSATVSGEIRGKLSADSSTFGGKLGLKVAF